MIEYFIITFHHRVTEGTEKAIRDSVFIAREAVLEAPLWEEAGGFRPSSASDIETIFLVICGNWV